MIHFNGHDKPLMEKWGGNLWWQIPKNGGERFRDIVSSRMEGAMVRFAGGANKPFRDLCPNIGF